MTPASTVVSLEIAVAMAALGVFMAWPRPPLWWAGFCLSMMGAALTLALVVAWLGIPP